MGWRVGPECITYVSEITEIYTSYFTKGKEAGDDGSVFKSSYRGPRLDSQRPHGSSQLSVTPVELEGFGPQGGHVENGESQQPAGDVCTPSGHGNHLGGSQMLQQDLKLEGLGDGL